MSARPLRIVGPRHCSLCRRAASRRLLAPDQVEPPRTERCDGVLDAACPASARPDRPGRQTARHGLFPGTLDAGVLRIHAVPGHLPDHARHARQRPCASSGTCRPGQRPRVLLVSVDPERDTPEIPRAVRAVLRSCIPGRHWHARSNDGGSSCVQTCRTRRSPCPDGGYTLDHRLGRVHRRPLGGTVAYLSSPHEAATIARDYRQHPSPGRSKRR